MPLWRGANQIAWTEPPSGRRHLDLLGAGQDVGVGGVVPRGAHLVDGAHVRGGEPALDAGEVDGGEAGRGGAEQGEGAVLAHVHAGDRGQRQVEVDDLAAGDREHSQGLAGVPMGDQRVIVVEHRVPGGAEGPHGAGELLLREGRVRGEHGAAAVGRGPHARVPPAGLVGDEQQTLRIQPLGLDDGDLGVPLGRGAAGDDLAGPGAAADERGDVQERAVPGHPRVLPADPGHARAVGAEPRVGDEAGGGGDAADRARVLGGRAVERDRGDVALDVRGAVRIRVRSLGAARVVLADPPDLAGAVRQGHRGGAGPAQGGAVGGLDLGADGRQGARVLPLGERIDPLVGEVHEEHEGIGVDGAALVGAVVGALGEVARDGDPRAPAVLVHAGAGVERARAAR
jgi:hypothetical protein